MRKLFQFVFLMTITHVAWGSCNTSTLVTTPDSASVQTCVNAASNGATITLSGGSATYSSTVTISKGLTIIVGAGQSVTITNSTSSGAAFSVSNTGSNFVRISGDNGSSSTCGTNGTCGLIINSPRDTTTFSHWVFIVEGPVLAFRIDHIFANQSDAVLCSNCQGSATGPVQGVVDHSYIQNFGRAYFAQDKRSTDGNAGSVAWGEFLGHENTYAGSNKMVYFEDDTFTWTETLNSGEGQASLYSQYGGKAVIRYSTLKNWSPQVIDEGDNPAFGTIYYELYNNNISENCSITPYGCEGKLMDLRSGQMLVHDNTITSTSIPFEVTVYPNGTQVAAHEIHNSYYWNNTWNGKACLSDSNPSGAVCLDVASDTQSPMTRNVNYWLRAPNQATDVYFDYTPYTYPHPLTQGGGVGPSPPSGLAATVQ